VAGVPLDLVCRLDGGEPVTEPTRDLLVVAYSAAAGGKIVEVARADSFATALRRMIDSMGLEGGDPSAYFFVPPEILAAVERIRSAADREFVLLFSSSFSVCLPDDFEDEEYLTDAEVTFPDHAPVIGWTPTQMTDVAYAILERREGATSRAAIEEQRLARRAAQLASRKKHERLEATHFLSRMADEGAVRLLRGALRDRQSDVRVAAGKALACMPSEAGFDALVAALDDQPDDGAQAGIVRAGTAILPRLEPHVAKHGPAIACCIGDIAERNGKLDERSRAMLFAIAAQPGWRSHEAVIPVLADPMLPHLPSARPFLERYTTSLSPTVRGMATKWLLLFDERED
jgi:hypothetical protein